MNNDDGALHYDLTIRSEQFTGAMNEAERRVKGFSSATVSEGLKIEKAFENLTQKITVSKELIAATEADIRKMEGMMKNIAPGAAKVDLIGELHAAKKALLEQKAALGDYEQQVKSAAAAHVTLRTQLRQMKEELVGMEAAGKRGSIEYDLLRKKFAELTNAMGDAQKQANVLANDQAGLQGLVQGLSGLSSIALGAQSAIGLFAGENENLQKVMLKVQSLMGLTITLQQVGNVLNKDSAFSLAILTRAKTAFAAAELRLATAFGISTVAAKALMATLTLGLSVAIGVAITAISRLATKAQEAKKATQEFNKATAEAAYQSLASFEKMRLEWNRLGDDMKAKNKFIKDSEDAFKDLGIQINGAVDAEKVFVKNTEAFRTALIERAKSVAAYEMAEALAKTLVEKELERDSTPQKTERYLFSGTPGEKGGTISKRSDKWVKIETERAFLESEIQKLFETGDKAAQKASSIISDIGVATTENLEKIVLLEQKISEQERLMLEAVEAGNTQEAKLIAKKIEQLQEELRLRNMLVNAIYAQGRANELLANSQANAWKPSGLNIQVGAPSTGGKEAGPRYNQQAVFDLETEKKTLAVMNQQVVNARNAEAIKKKLKKVDEEMKEITEDELQLRKEIIAAISETTAILERAGFISQEMGTQLQGMISVAGSLMTGDYLSAIVSAVGMFADSISQVLDASDGFEKRLERMNDLLEQQARLVEKSEREGGGKEKREVQIDSLRQQVKIFEEQVAKAEKRLQNAYKWNLTGTQREKELKEVQAAAKEAQLALEDAEQAYKDFLTGGVTQDSIANTIAAGLMEGKRSVEDFAQDMNNILSQAVTNAISAKILGPAIDELTNYLASAMEDGVLSPEEAERYKTQFGLIAAQGKELADASSAALGGSSELPDKTLSGSIKGVTEQTAGALAGQMNAMRINQVDGIQIMRTQLAHLAEIASNTRYLQSIDKKLDGLNSDPLRATGMNI